MLTNQEKKKLRSLGHDEKVLVYIGKNGLSDSLKESFYEAILQHNLVKVSIQKNSSTRKEEVLSVFVDEFGSELVHQVGRVFYFYKYHEDGRIKI